jgi:hypothetical protein
MTKRNIIYTLSVAHLLAYMFIGIKHIQSAEIILTPIQSTQKEIKGDQSRIHWMLHGRNTILIDLQNNEIRGGSGNFYWTLEGTLNTKLFIVRESFITGEKTNFDISDIVNEKIWEKNIIIGMNRPTGFLFEISPDDRYILIRLYGNRSILYDTLENKKDVKFDNIEESKNDIMLGFDKQGNVYCGTQDIAPMFLLRAFPSGKILKTFGGAINAMNYTKSDFIPRMIGEKDQFKLGIIHNYLAHPIENRGEKYAAFSFTVFQFQYIYAIVLVYDNKTGQCVFKQIVDTSAWNTNVPNFLFSHDETHFFYRDSYKEIVCVDLKKRLTISCFSTSRKNNFLDFRAIDDFFITPDNNVVIQAKIPEYYYQSSPSLSPLEIKPYTLTYIWNPLDNSVTYPKPYVKEGAYTLKHWISPDKKIIATYYVDYDSQNFSIAQRRREAPDTIAFGDISTGNLLHKIEGNITSVNFSPNWKLINITTLEEKEHKVIQTTTKYSITIE